MLGIFFQCFAQKPSICFVVFFLYQSPNTNLFLSTWPSCRFLKNFWGPSSLDCPKAPLMRQQVFFPISCRSFLMGQSVSYLWNSLSQRPIWGTRHLLYPSYCYIFIKSLPILIRSNRCQQLWSIPLPGPSPFEDGGKVLSIGGSGMCSSFHVVC